jgi:serine phosphatase RsbU (regulator of sigma subunit)
MRKRGIDHRRHRRGHAHDLNPAAHLGRRAGLALDNVRLFLAERTATLTLQRSLLPEIPHIPGLDIAAAYIPSGRRAEVGGDWFDVLPLPDGAIGLTVGDVVGHDLPSALLRAGDRVLG